MLFRSAENKLFATLDTTVRKVIIENLPFLLTDTVGFIRKLPTDLVDSFTVNNLSKGVKVVVENHHVRVNLALELDYGGNSLLLILGAALFFGHASDISAFSQMYNALQDSKIAGAVASSTLSTLFALALLASGQNSTITGTLTGQIVMEGFLHMRLPQWVIRLFTRLFALLPVIIVAILYGDQEKTLDQLLV